VAEEAVASESEGYMAWAGCSISALVPLSRLGAIMIWGSRLVGEANGRTSSVVRLGMSVGRTRSLVAPWVAA